MHWAMPSLWDGAAMEDIFPYISTFPIACPPVASPNDTLPHNLKFRGVHMHACLVGCRGWYKTGYVENILECTLCTQVSAFVFLPLLDSPRQGRAASGSRWRTSNPPNI